MDFFYTYKYKGTFDAVFETFYFIYLEYMSLNLYEYLIW